MEEQYDDQMDGSQHVCARVELARARGWWFYLWYCHYTWNTARIKIIMASAISRLNCASIIKDRVEARFTHAAIALELQRRYPGESGLSARSVKRYCSDNDIHYSSCLNQEQVDQLVEQAVFQVYYTVLVLYSLS